MTITRQQVTDLLEQADRPLSRRQLSSMLGLDKAESDRLLKPVLVDMIADGALVRNRRAYYGLPRQMDLVAGRISAHADGFGFVIPDAGGEDLYLGPKEMRRVFHGDRVLAAVTRVDRRGRREGAIVEILERAHEKLVGRLIVEDGIAMVVPDDPRLIQEVLVPTDQLGGASPGRIVVVRITRPPSVERPPLGHVIAVLGHADEPGMATEIAIYNHQLPAEFADGVIGEAEGFGDSVSEDDKQGRRDYRDLPLITIDGADARDFDDAVFARALSDGFQLIVAIADVAHYVRPGSALDDEANLRGTSVYFPDRVIPMLPETLSNGLCSLNPRVDRLALVCEMRIDANGKVKSSRFHNGVIRSHARLTYDQVRRMMEQGDQRLRERYAEVMDNLDALYALYRKLRKRRERRGALDFDSEAVYFQFDSEGRVENIRPYVRHDAHKLIEECMIAANVEAARFVSGQELPMLFRVHEPPQSAKLEDLEAFLSAQGIKVRWKSEPEPAQFAAIQAQVAGRPTAPLVNAVLLRALSLAVYQPENLGHFGLALSAYAHFTSPIRRYPDLLLHRAIKHAIGRQDRSFDHSAAQMAEFGRHCSWTERRAEEASRDVDARLKCQFMQRHLGDLFNGTVSGVTGFGLFVELDGLGVSGLVHVTAMPNDYYQFDPVSHSLTGKRRGQTVRLADRVRIEVAAVNIDERKIDFRLVEVLD